MGEPRLAQEELEQFLSLIYADETGYSYVATKNLVNPDRNIQEIKWSQHFFKWPQEKEKLSAFILESTPTLEVYYSPALFSQKVAQKEAVQASRVFWCEFDGKVPEDIGDLPQPTIRIQSSIPGHEHWYWCSDTPLSPVDLEDVNRKLAYALGADTSGWDAGQVLRPLGTRNHKREADVKLKYLGEGAVGKALFASLPDPPPVLEAPIPESIPAIEDVVPKYKFEETVWHLFKKGSPNGDRSDGLMSMGYYLAEMQLPNDEMFSVLLNCDERWGKFKGRRDQHKRLMEIVVRSRVKFPLKAVHFDVDISLKSYGLKSLLKLEEKVEWLWHGLLHRTGYMLVTGPSGVGKTQFSLDAAAKLVLGQKHLGRDCEVENIKIGFFSLEMGVAEIKNFLATQSSKYSEEELDILEENLRIYPLGEPIYLTSDKEKSRVEEVVLKEGLSGIIFDSLGSVTDASLSSEENVKNLMDWNDRIRKRLGIFTWYIHHHRKASGENKKPNKLGDVYGSQYITARASSVLCLWDTGTKDTIQCISLKARFTEKPAPFNMHRDKHLRFHEKVVGITLTDDGESANEVAATLPVDPTSLLPGKNKSFKTF